jgi:phospholipid/cholesterol/gamma-HCH transport system substrate-binding protein
MPSQQQVKWSQLKIGLLVLAAITLLLVLIFLMSGTSGGFFARKLTIRSYFENAAGLKVGAPVSLDGVTIGSVAEMRIAPDHKLTPVEVTMRVSSKFHNGLRRDSKAALSTIGVLGDTIIDINSQYASGPLLQDGDVLQTNETPTIPDVIKASQGTVEQLNVILAKLNTLIDNISGGKGSIGQLVSNDALYHKVYDTMDELHRLTNNLNQGKGSLGKLMTNDDLYNRANATVDSLQKAAAELNNGQGTAGKLLKDPSLYNNLNQAVENTNTLVANINAGKGSIGYLAKDPAFAKKLNDSVTQLDSILIRINKGEGTLGQLSTNDTLYKNTDQLLVESRSLVGAIRQNPKKYLSIRLRLF